jgi:hypothetical protein
VGSERSALIRNFPGQKLLAYVPPVDRDIILALMAQADTELRCFDA